MNPLRLINRTNSSQSGFFRRVVLTVLLFLFAFQPAISALDDDPLPSWNEGKTKSAIIEFVKKVTMKGSDDFVSPAERIATFDNDGTLWAEQPYYFQLAFAVDRIKELAKDHPDWKTTEPFAAVLNNDFEAFADSGMKGLVQLIAESHAGMSTDEFSKIVAAWLKTAKHPRFDRPYQTLVYKPMLELLEYLRANGFKTYITSGGGTEFMRVFAEDVYSIPPEQVIGSTIKTKFEFRNGKPVIQRLPEIDFVDDKAGKPVAINGRIGRRPIASFGNSDGDLQMLQWTAAGNGPNLCLIVHHTDAEREWAYDRNSKIGKLDIALDEAKKRGWVLVDMKGDWNVVFPESNANLSESR